MPLTKNNETYDLTPVPHAATIEAGTACERDCPGCGFNTTELEPLTAEQISEATQTLSNFWSYAESKTDDFQVIGPRIVEVIGGAGYLKRYSPEDFRMMLDVAKMCKAKQLAFMCDAEKDLTGIKAFFEQAQIVNAREGNPINAVIALSVDSLFTISPQHDRERKTNATLGLLNNVDQVLTGPNQQIRIFTTMSKQNLEHIPEIAKRVLSVSEKTILFVAPLTIHSDEVLSKTNVRDGRLLMGSGERAVQFLIDEQDRVKMEKVVVELRKLKEQYPARFLNVPSTFDNMLDVCKPINEPFKRNCRESCSFRAPNLNGFVEKLITTPNFRVMKRPDQKEMTLGVCTCLVGPTDDPNDYANTPLKILSEVAEGKADFLDILRRLTRSLVKLNCPGCNTRTAIEFKKGEVLR